MLYCSFSKQAGNFGCQFHNAGFEELGINAIYKSFSVTDISKAIDAMHTLDIKGAAISMPFKVQVIDYVDHITPQVEEIGAANTILQVDNKLVAYNTDWLAAFRILEKEKNPLVILGDGGFAKAVKYAAHELGMPYINITRSGWKAINSLRHVTIFNATPAEVEVHPTNKYISCQVGTMTGNEIARFSARAQFKLYTGKSYPL